MPDRLILIVVLVGLLAWGEVRHWLDGRRWAADRTLLLNRVQSGTLRDYAFCKPEVETVKPAAVHVDPGQTLEQLTSLGPDATIPESALIQAQSTYRDKMGD